MAANKKPDKAAKTDASTKVKKSDVAKAIALGRGIKTEIAKKLKVSRQTLDNYLKRWPDLVPKLAEAREVIIDFAEIGLEKLIKKGDVRAIIFTLETIGRDRGYQKRTEITGANGRPVLELSPELALLMAKLGISGSDVVRSLEHELKVAAGAAS
jgi:hypothetical protein